VKGFQEKQGPRDIYETQIPRWNKNCEENFNQGSDLIASKNVMGQKFAKAKKNGVVLCNLICILAKTWTFYFVFLKGQKHRYPQTQFDCNIREPRYLVDKLDF